MVIRILEVRGSGKLTDEVLSDFYQRLYSVAMAPIVVIRDREHELFKRALAKGMETEDETIMGLVMVQHLDPYNKNALC